MQDGIEGLASKRFAIFRRACCRQGSDGGCRWRGSSLRRGRSGCWTKPTTGLDQRSLVLLCEHMRSHLDHGGIIIAATHGTLGLKPAAVIALGETA